MSTSLNVSLDLPPMKAVASATRRLNVLRYGELLKRFAPKVIETDKEHQLA